MNASSTDALPRARQRRSRETLARILDAFEVALEEQTFEAVTVADICRRAGCSVGTFYGRVESKEGLLAHLQARVYGEIEAATVDAFDAVQWKDTSLERMLTMHARLITELHARRRGVVRAVIVEARRRNDFARETVGFNRDLLDRVARTWATKTEAIAHPDPELACRHAALMAAGYLREAVVFADLWPSAGAVSQSDAIAASLAHMLISYLTTSPPKE